MDISPKRVFHTILFYFPVFILVTTYILRIYVILTQGNNYGFDETLVTEISKNTIPAFYELVKVEPHPPGFFLFLKLFDVDNILQTRLMLVSLSSGLMLIALGLGYKTGFIQHFNLRYGLGIFFLTPIYSTVAVFVKQEVISLPVFFLGVIVLYVFHKEKKLWQFLLINLITVCLLLFGYTYFVFYVLWCGFYFFTLFRKTDRYLLWYVGMLTFLCSIYFLFLGYAQITINSKRFGWVHYYDPSFFKFIDGGLSGFEPANIVSDIIIVVYLVGLFIFVSTFKSRTFVEKLLSFFFIAVIGFSYVTKVFIPRYLIIPLAVSIVATSWGFASLPDFKWKKVLLSSFLSFYLLLGFVWIYLGSFYELTIYKNWSNSISQALYVYYKAEHGKVGFLSGQHLNHFVVQLRYLRDPRVIPLSLGSIMDFYSNPELTPEKLKLIGSSIEADVPLSKTLLKSTGLSTFIYTQSSQSNDYAELILKTLSESCTIIHPGFYESFLNIYFSDCKF